MRAPSPRSALSILFGVIVLALAIGSHRLSRAIAERQAASRVFQRSLAMANEASALGRRQEQIAVHPRPDQDVIAQVNAVMASLGIPTDRFHSLEAGTDVAVSEPGGRVSRYRRQSVSLALRDLRPEEIGGFLESWCTSQKIWIPSRVELHHARDQREAEGLYDARVVVTATYLTDGGAS